jgi:large subunit ribosomal protein L20
MTRVRHSVASRKRRKRVLKRAKGYVGGRHRLHRTAKETVKRAMRYSYRDRKTRKREFRSLWIVRINAACRSLGVKYSEFINGLKKAKIALDRKSLAELAVNNRAAFKKLISIIKEKTAPLK